MKSKGLNQAEKDYLQQNNLSQPSYIYNLLTAQSEAIVYFGSKEGFENRTGIGNAFLHAILICRNAYTFGINHAIALGNAHEIGADGQPMNDLDAQMDRFNNNIGIQIYQSCLSCFIFQYNELIIKKIKDGDFRIIKNGQLVPSNQ